jgi:hypothetical protein
LAIILHTCEFPQGNSWAKRITKKAIQVLNSEDLVGAMAQTMNGDEWIFRTHACVEVCRAGAAD